jgi:hypothetical protein
MKAFQALALCNVAANDFMIFHLIAWDCSFPKNTFDVVSNRHVELHWARAGTSSQCPLGRHQRQPKGCRLELEGLWVSRSSGSGGQHQHAPDRLRQ